MSKKTFTEQYNEIMERYSKGRFGSGLLTLGDILREAGKPELFDEASLEELQEFKKKAVGIYTKMAWGCAIKQWEKKQKRC